VANRRFAASKITYAGDLRRKAIVLIFIYGMDAELIGAILGSHERTVRRWITKLEKTGKPDAKATQRECNSKW
jgi:transposase